MFRSAELDSPPVSETIRVDTPVGIAVPATGIQPSFSEYKGSTDVPYAAHFFGLDSVYPHLPSVDVRNIQAIEVYLTEKIGGGEFVDSDESARSIITQMLTSVGADEFNTPYTKIQKLAELLSVLPEPVPPTHTEPTYQQELRERERSHKQELKELERETREVKKQTSQIQRMAEERARAAHRLAEERKKTITKLLSVL